MRDITSDMMSYLEARRHLWNVHFREKVDSIVEPSALDEYEYIGELLFLGLVLRDLGVTSYPEDFTFTTSPIKEVIIRPDSFYETIRISLGTEFNGGGARWESDIPVSPKGLELEFIEFFEWARYDFVAYPLVMGRIVKFDEHKEYIGRRALIQNMYVHFVAKAKK